MLNLDFPGWHLIGRFADGDYDGVGSWLLVSGGEAILLEIPPGLAPRAVARALHSAGAELCVVTASHTHWDHFDPKVWRDLMRAFPEARFIHPASVCGDLGLQIGGEPAWLIRGPKHSPDDVVTIFRGVAMTGDIELGMLDSVNDEVFLRTKRRSMTWLRGFQERHGYHIHTTVSAHLNSVQRNVDWRSLFTV